MELIRGTHNLRSRHRNCVLTIGNFDGVHLGHAEVIKSLVEKGKQLDLPVTVMLFEPQPQEHFAGDKAPPRLSRLRDKVQRLSELGVERILCVSFNQRFAQLSHTQFVEQLLVEKLGVQFLVVGDDFCFGKGRQGNFDTLVEAGNRHGFDVVPTASFRVQQQRVSSTLIRQALKSGELEQANAMLGYPYQITGRVRHGRKLGRTIGFPTANIAMNRRVSPLGGVYAVRAFTRQGDCFVGVANVGRRPTVAGTRCQLEVHLFDFTGDLYGQHLRVELLHHLRHEQAFDSLDALQNQISKDAAQAKALLSAS
ncbi:bifunctional riboflavin kinase/FAD synthetase [Ferrimonas aestuarii]|uniref:Riboflavin biosynthesis protein n=1 Tax=Ferrimonas aestuarii TaxID=2569539 RepID=A0A4U1BGR2_9GAMM|nr:bifunctional riboflavin kinase/FAD synthetase [Ferrimonas aestuarii]TKB50190.1 bifunctional riboflavin kinase/FAD synthetase [Ferrimonas aestuarii]